MDWNKGYCQMMLKAARKAAKQYNVSIGRLLTHRVKSLSNSASNWFEVREDGYLVWEGRAYNANQAKANAIWEKIEETLYCFEKWQNAKRNCL